MTGAFETRTDGAPTTCFCPTSIRRGTKTLAAEAAGCGRGAVTVQTGPGRYLLVPQGDDYHDEIKFAGW